MKDQLNKIWNLFLFMLRNKYLVVIVVFIAWVAFLDTYNLVDRFKNLQNLNRLKTEAKFFREEINDLKIRHQEIFSDKEDLEKFARETFLMKEDNEDVFLIISEN